MATTMARDSSEFDPEKLNARKENYCGFKFCPLCGNSLREKKLDGQIRLSCSDNSCDFIYYQNPVPAAGAIVMQDNKILLVKRAHPPRIGHWCIPAGFMEWSEHPEQTTIRELKEETGLDVKINSLFNIYTGDDDPRSNSVLILYLADKIGGKMVAADDALDVGFFDINDLPKEIAFEAHLRAINEVKEKLFG